MARAVRIALAMMLAAQPALADVTAKDARRAVQLFEQGRKKIAAKEIDGACEAFAASLALDPQLGTRLNLASCREQQGRLREAHELYDQAASEAARTGKASRASFARQQLQALEARAVRVRVQITNPAGTTATLGGQPIEPSELQIVMPGTIVVEVTAEGKRPARVEKTGAAGSELTIDIPALEPIAAPIAQPGAAVPATIVATPREPAARGAVAHPARSHADLYAGATGVVLGLASAGFLVHGKLRYDDAYKAGDRAGVASAQREADIATGLAIASGAAFVIAVALFVHGRGESDGVAVAPVATTSSIGLAIGGAW